MKKPFHINPCLPLSGQNMPVISAAESNVSTLRHHLFPIPLSFFSHGCFFHFLHLLFFSFYLITIEKAGTYLLYDLSLDFFCSFHFTPSFYLYKSVPFSQNCIFNGSCDYSVTPLQHLLAVGIKQCEPAAT